jgi:uncharacterized protein (DUF608 family)
VKAVRYRGRQRREIRFPLGGIGTGCIGLAGDGRLVDWQIFNRPNQDSINGFSHFAVRAESRGRVVDARVLHGDLEPPYVGAGGGGSIGSGPPRETMAGLPHFRDTVFSGHFPFASIDYRDSDFPGRIRLTAFNPFIPMQEDDSGIPAAFFSFELHNSTTGPLDYTLAATLANPFPKPQVHRLQRQSGRSLLQLGTTGLAPDDRLYGELTVGTDAARVSHQDYWFRGPWFDALEVFWRDWTTPGPLRNRRYAPAEAGDRNQATLAAHVRLAPGERQDVRFIVAWHVPNCENDWNATATTRARAAGIAPTWKNYYATRWSSSRATATYALKNWTRLHRDSLAFHEALFASTVPPEVLDAVSANLAILKSPTVMRLEDGTFYGFEGCNSTTGCCEGTCTHVWNYAQALPFLFPGLERTVREADYRYNQLPNGGMPFRLQLPLGLKHAGGRSCADGLFGNVLAVYRNWKITGDTDWLRRWWPAVKASIAYAWHPDNEDRWDPERSGVLSGRQHHTLDMELFGPSSWLCGFYLGALKAGADMAAALGEADTAASYRDMFARGQAWMEANLFNGEYYQQRVNLADRRQLRQYGADGYWNAEHGEVKYQIGEGCAADQTLAQYHATLYGLGDLFKPARRRRALRAIFRNNFQPMRRVYNPCRLYALNDEQGLAICSWPKGRRKPAIPITYAQECMNGFEYAAAVQMIQNGLHREGLAVVRAVRERYDGERRNPWNEFECGSYYARSMASYALLLAYSGFQFDMRRGMIGFQPALPARGRFQCFWALHTGWGTVDFRAASVTLLVSGGTLTLERFALPDRPAVSRATLAGQRVACERDGAELVFERAITLQAGARLVLR